MKILHVLLLIGPVAAWRPTYLFKQWFPNWRPEIATAMESPLCQQNIANFRNTSYPVQSAFGVIDCILQEWPDFRQAELNAAGVILDIAVVALSDRPLAILLAIANSEVLPQLPAAYDTAIIALQNSVAGGDAAVVWAAHWWTRTPLRRVIAWTAPYVVAAAAAANTLYIIVRLTTWAVCSFSPGLNIFPPMWLATNFICYGVGYALVLLRYTKKQKLNITNNLRVSDSITGVPLLVLSNKEAEKEEVRSSLVLECKYQPTCSVDLNNRDQQAMIHREWAFRILAGLLYLGSFLHMTFGTIVFASLLFISVRDSTGIGLQLIGSTLVTRIVLYAKTSLMDVKLVQQA